MKARVLALSIVNSPPLAFYIVAGACSGDGDASPGESAMAEDPVRPYEVSIVF